MTPPTNLLTFSQFIQQPQPLRTRTTTILSSQEPTITMKLFRPGPHLFKLRIKCPLKSIDNFVAYYWEKFVTVTTSSGCYEEVLVCWVVSYYEVAIWAVMKYVLVVVQWILKKKSGDSYGGEET